MNIDTAVTLAYKELLAATSAHGPMRSAHEGWSIIFEELEELREHVRTDTGSSSEAITEAKQVAAMALRYMVDLGKEL